MQKYDKSKVTSVCVLTDIRPLPVQPVWIKILVKAKLICSEMLKNW